jgi:hypothetical protein
MLVEVDDDNVDAFTEWRKRWDYKIVHTARPGIGNEDYFVIASES